MPKKFARLRAKMLRQRRARARRRAAAILGSMPLWHVSQRQRTSARIAATLPEITPPIVRRYSVRGLRRALGLTQHEFAAALGINRSQVARWERERHVPGPARGGSAPKARMEQLAKIAGLGRVLWPDRQQIRLWLRDPAPTLGGRRPVDVLVSEGPARIVEDLRAALGDGYA